MIRQLVGRHSAQQLALQRLDAVSVAQMAEACTPGVQAEVIARVQRTADGIPFLVEEVLASPGVPASFRETVRARLAEFSAHGAPRAFQCSDPRTVLRLAPTPWRN